MTIVPFLRNVANVILNPLIFLMFAIAFLYFVWGAIRFLSSDADDKGNNRKESRDSMVWGILGMVIMFSVYGLVNFVLNTFGVVPNNAAVNAIIRNY